MNFWPLAVFSVCAVASVSLAAEIPQEVQALDRIYQKRCTQACVPHIAAFTQKALVLQKKCVQRSDFEGAKVIHDGLEELKKNNFDWRLVKETCQISIPRDGWYGSVANMIHKLDAEGNHYDIQEFRKKFKNTGEKVNTELTGPDLIVFTGAPNRLWLIIDSRTIFEIYTNNIVARLIHDSSKEGTNVGSADEIKDAEWLQMQNDLKKRCFQACSEITKKYIQALDKLKLKLSADGDMTAAVAVHEYAKRLESGNLSPERDRSLKTFEGNWKDGSGLTYRFNGRGEGTVKKSNGTTDFTMTPVRSSPHGDFHYFNVSSGGSRIATRVADKVYIIMQDGRKDWLRVCKRIGK